MSKGIFSGDGFIDLNIQTHQRADQTRRFDDLRSHNISIGVIILILDKI